MAKFIQIIDHRNPGWLYALDDEGVIWIVIDGSQSMRVAEHPSKKPEPKKEKESA